MLKALETGISWCCFRAMSGAPNMFFGKFCQRHHRGRIRVESGTSMHFLSEPLQLTPRVDTVRFDTTIDDVKLPQAARPGTTPASGPLVPDFVVDQSRSSSRTSSKPSWCFDIWHLGMYIDNLRDNPAKK